MRTSQSVRCASTPFFIYRAHNGRSSNAKAPGHGSAFTSHTYIRKAVIPIALGVTTSALLGFIGRIDRRANVLRGGYAIGNGVTQSFQQTNGELAAGCFARPLCTLRPVVREIPHSISSSSSFGVQGSPPYRNTSNKVSLVD